MKCYNNFNELIISITCTWWIKQFKWDTLNILNNVFSLCYNKLLFNNKQLDQYIIYISQPLINNFAALKNPLHITFPKVDVDVIKTPTCTTVFFWWITSVLLGSISLLRCALISFTFSFILWAFPFFFKPPKTLWKFMFIDVFL